MDFYLIILDRLATLGPYDIRIFGIREIPNVSSRPNRCCRRHELATSIKHSHPCGISGYANEVFVKLYPP
ncbi:MAG: hypothetical protein VBE63_02930 [Lamprobacter sp.]|nr:hypothetical protein [Lamprobacter sp.]